MSVLYQIPDQIGYLILTEDGAVITSGGELDNNEEIANIIIGILSLTNKIDSKTFPADEAINTISIAYPDHCYMICLSNKKIHIVKKKLGCST